MGTTMMARSTDRIVRTRTGRTIVTHISSTTNSADHLVSELSGVLAQMGGVLLSAETVETAVSLVTQLAVATIPASVGAGVTLVDAQGKRTTAASDALVERADELQYELDDGPCLTAWRERVAVLIDDVELDTRWPEWTAAVGHLGIESVLSVPLVTGKELRKLEGHVSQAKGVLLAQGAGDDQRAFGMLVSAAQRSMSNVEEVARRIVASITVDGPDHPTV